LPILVPVVVFIAKEVAGEAVEQATGVPMPTVKTAGRFVFRQSIKAEAAKGAADVGRAGKQARLRELANDDKLGSADRGWIKQELNSIDRGQRSTIRNPPGKDLAHERGREAAKGYDYRHSNLQDRDLHRLQHKYDDFGRANAERPLP
ncbi:MAG: polymorphic toxin type 8 domain-containing protein, partial [Pseudomonadota bacterium]